MWPLGATIRAVRTVNAPSLRHLCRYCCPKCKPKVGLTLFLVTDGFFNSGSFAETSVFEVRMCFFGFLTMPLLVY